MSSCQRIIPLAWQTVCTSGHSLIQATLQCLLHISTLLITVTASWFDASFSNKYFLGLLNMRRPDQLILPFPLRRRIIFSSLEIYDWEMPRCSATAFGSALYRRPGQTQFHDLALPVVNLSRAWQFLLTWCSKFHKPSGSVPNTSRGAVHCRPSPHSGFIKETSARNLLLRRRYEDLISVHLEAKVASLISCRDQRC